MLLVLGCWVVMKRDRGEGGVDNLVLEPGRSD